MNTTKLQDGGRPWRVTVRLDGQRAAVLRRLSESSGSDPSRILREALDHFEFEHSVPEQVVSAGMHSAVPTTVSDHVAANVPVKACEPQRVGKANREQSNPVSRGDGPRPGSGHLVEFMSQYKAMGAQLWPERRRLFQRLFCTTLLAMENRENPQDRVLHNELLRLGRAHGLFN